MDTTIGLELAAVYRHNAQLRQYSPKEIQIIKGYIDKNLERGYIKRGISKNSVGLIFVPKKGTDELQVCGNYIPLNRVLKQRTLRHCRQLHMYSTYFCGATVSIGTAYYAQHGTRNTTSRKHITTSRYTLETTIVIIIVIAATIIHSRVRWRRTTSARAPTCPRCRKRNISAIELLTPSPSKMTRSWSPLETFKSSDAGRTVEGTSGKILLRKRESLAQDAPNSLIGRAEA